MKSYQISGFITLTLLRLVAPAQAVMDFSRRQRQQHLALIVQSAFVVTFLTTTTPILDADLITYEFTATVDDAFTEGGGITSIGPGTSVSGFLTFESTAQDTNPDTSHGEYLDAVTDWEFSLTGATQRRERNKYCHSIRLRSNRFCRRIRPLSHEDLFHLLICRVVSTLFWGVEIASKTK